jgi:hypothetical protein
MRLQVVAEAIFNRGIVLLIYFGVTVITCIQVVLKSSLAVGAAALAASALCFFGVASFVGSFLARHEKDYSVKDLIGIGAIATILVAVGLWLMIWSGFWINLFGVVVEGRYWALVGIITALVVTRKKDAS